jgi:hypothetical protein
MLFSGLLALSAISCRTEQKPEKPGAEFASFILSDVPKDVEHPTFIDFGGKVHLVGYNIEPKGIVTPGSKVKLTMFWRSNQRLGPGWSLFTHLDSPGVPRENLDDDGPLRKLVSGPDGARRQALGPSQWEPGRVYVDELEFELPKNVDSPEATVLAGIWRENEPKKSKSDEDKADDKTTYPGLRLDVVSGPSDGAERAVVVHLQTGRDGRSKKPAQAAAPKPLKRAPGAAEPRQR